MDINPKIEAARAGGGVGLATSYALTLQDWVGILTIVFLVVQIVILFPKLWATVRAWFK